ncbi:sigma factor-like helix-turn-helix DNA-binding protein [Lacticaseibacillus mingshuiensis]|uniref:Sigma factor-like helix-turn-helix DNA-binding protein n=1 Tax=Lacticaseibacillus mingshuiensis TaxID=2799574 RepID=A0ABW4CJF0_9LACO|nr:sigma factor-like helix-turn-helix DNA-binding protein [Lacticaseibacillus mingshuiensis]
MWRFTPSINGEATPERNLETFNNLAVRYLYRAFVDGARNTKLRLERETMKYEERVDVVDSRDEVERRVMLDVLYRSLTPREKPVFELVYLQDLSIEEAANRLGKTRRYVWQVRKEIHEHHQVPDFIDRKRGPMVS